MSLELETVAEIIGDEQHREEAPGAFVPETLPETPGLPADGIYFGMPEEEYFSLPALSSHGIRKLAASPMVFWASTSWLSEKRRKAERERALEERTHQVVGKAYHCRIMEGAEEFARRFAIELDPSEYADALESTDQIKAALQEAGEKPVPRVQDELPDGSPYLRAAKKDDWIDQLLDVDPTAKVLSRLKQQHREANQGKSFISLEAYEQIEIAAAMIERDPEICHAFKGGYPEVVLIWHCQRTGVPMKARVDYLKLRSIVDLKSIGNERERSLEQAIRFTIAGYHYNVQPSVYVEGVTAVRRLVREQGRAAVWSNSGSGSCGAPSNSEAEWARKWAELSDTEFMWVFQQKGDAPVTRGVFYPLAGTTRMLTDDIILKQKRRFRQFSETFGVDPWLDVRPIYDLADEDLPASATEI